MREQLLALRKEMKAAGIQAYLIPTDDFHGSEYVGDYFKCRKYISGFTGSAGTLLVMEDMAGLWTDGRYFLQAAKQLYDTGITLFKMGEPGVPSIPEFLKKHLTKGMTFGFDGRCMMVDQAERYHSIVEACGAEMNTEHDLVDKVWSDRPALSHAPAWLLDAKYSGSTREAKIAAVREEMKKLGADTFVLASLDDICWLLDVRGNDVESTPVVLSYLVMTQEAVTWYVQDISVDDTVRKAMKESCVTIAEYNDVYANLKKLSMDKTVLYQPSKTNYALASCIPEGVKVLRDYNPTELLKALKNPTEVANEYIAHVKDGVALTRFMYYVKKKSVENGETEVSLAEKLIAFRKEQGHYIEESFSPIIGYADHGAIVHYSANKDTDRPIGDKGFLLVDTGGHYLEGTTDTTRTFVMGALTQEEKELYTAVLRGHIDLAAARFKKGCIGQNLDILARSPLWDLGYDFNHGTGHGVGYLLNVHEGPNSIRLKPLPSRPQDCPMMEGMITSDEPGVYLEGKFGIRLENLIVCCKDPEAEGFLCFDPMTMVPFEKDAIIPERMTEKELAWLNAYHAKVYEKISPYLPIEEKEWLYDMTTSLK